MSRHQSHPIRELALGRRVKLYSPRCRRKPASTSPSIPHTALDGQRPPPVLVVKAEPQAVNGTEQKQMTLPRKAASLAVPGLPGEHPFWELWAPHQKEVAPALLHPRWCSQGLSRHDFPLAASRSHRCCVHTTVCSVYPGVSYTFLIVTTLPLLSP